MTLIIEIPEGFKTGFCGSGERTLYFSGLEFFAIILTILLAGLEFGQPHLGLCHLI
jgi:hypothetical protein